MAVFAVIGQPSQTAEKLSGAISTTFPNANFKLLEQVWLVNFVGTAQDLSDKLGVTDGANGTAVILETASYFGRASPNIWTWIKSNWEKG